jgi:hypothetical protein
MKKTLVVALIVLSQTGVVSVAKAEGCHDKVKMSCADSHVWDDASQTCLPKPSA